MRLSAIFAASLGLVALVGVAGEASAQSRSRAPAVTLAEASNAQNATPAQPRRGLRWNENGRWGLDFNLNQPVGREAEWGDVEAGAYYRLSPRLRVGAAAGLAAPEQDPARAPETDRRGQPRVRLETLFRF
ncbi:NtrZ family periplasmic regulatory protein [Brevundimonas staleyi]|uniref:NtrZ family periplasmic regulatory protein n=1 Tax=Brevundimonas staleyi TaxID=74326 RepID=A0ABW0FWF0_9CAUL